MTTKVLHEYRPRGSAVALFNCRSSEILVSGPAGTGKSRACLEKMHILCLKHPGITCLIVRKTLASLGSTALKTYREIVAAEAIEAGIVEFYGGSAEKPPQYRYYNGPGGAVGSSIVIGGMDKPSKVMSSEYDVIYVQEAVELTETDWQALTTRLRNWKLSFQQLIADTNPDKPTHWLKTRCSEGTTVMLESRHEENPEIFDDNGKVTEHGREYITKLDALTGVRKLRLRKGLWVAAEGVIYDEWDPSIHLIDRFQVPDSWPRWWAVDFGYTHPFVLQRWAEDGDGRLFMYAEQYHTHMLVEDHARSVLDLVCPGAAANSAAGTHGTWREPKPRAIICDHDAEDRATLERHLGMSTVAANKAVNIGIQSVQSRLRLAGDNRARLFRNARQCTADRPGFTGSKFTHMYRRRIRRVCMGRHTERTTRKGTRRRYGCTALHGSAERFGITSGHSVDQLLGGAIYASCNA